MNCYDCKFVRNVQGSAHKMCAHPIVLKKNREDIMEAIGPMLHHKVWKRDWPLMKEMNVKIIRYGYKNAWANWPFVFDPIWIKNCGKFEEKEKA